MKLVVSAGKVVTIFCVFVVFAASCKDNSSSQSKSSEPTSTSTSTSTSTLTFENNCPVATRREDLLQFCQMKSQPSADEKVFLDTYNAEICDRFISDDGSGRFAFSCSIYNLVSKNILNIVETEAVTAYTEEFYNYINKRKDGKIIAKSSGRKNLDKFEAVLVQALKKLRIVDEYQFEGKELYRGADNTKLDKLGTEFQLNRWSSTSCVKEIAFGPSMVERNWKESASLLQESIRGFLSSSTGIPDAFFNELIASVSNEVNQQNASEAIAAIVERLNAKLSEIGDPGIGNGELTKLLYVRDPQSIVKESRCQNDYYRRSSELPLNDGETFTKATMIYFKPLPKGQSRGVALYSLSGRDEGEVLFPPTAKFRISAIVDLNDRNKPAEAILQEISSLPRDGSKLALEVHYDEIP